MFEVGQKVQAKKGGNNGVVIKVIPPKDIYGLDLKVIYTIPTRFQVKLSDGKFKGESIIFEVDKIEAA